MEGMNRAFIMKLAWGMLHENSLWVQFLKDKYMNSVGGEGLPVANLRDSVLWKSICKEWEVVNQNVSWNLGEGKTVLFWKDSWLENNGPLINLINPGLQVDTINHTVANMVDRSGNWKWEEFAHLLPMQTLMGIVGYIPPRQDADADSMIWKQTSDGKFTVKTAYLAGEEGDNVHRDPVWKIIWKWKGLERIKVFLWTVAHNAVMTNELRWRRRITDNRYCCYCGNAVENLIHVLRDCPKARRVWEGFVGIEERELFFSQNQYTWIISNLTSRKKCMRYGEWQLAFGITIWRDVIEHLAETRVVGLRLLSR
uniref:Reverse transcriptase zinc-binding domain-containing protein n=1 Tax=Salix viminalis TaxID=40686 RepID=A0A6N2N1I9_SALVM